MKVLLALVVAAFSGASWAQCRPLETGRPNVPSQEPAFEGQTRACAAQSDVAFEVEVLARGLTSPWAVEPLPGGELLVTEKPGQLRIVSSTGEIGPPIAGVPQVDARGQGGLLDVALSPRFEKDATVFLSYAEPRKGGNGTAVARGALSKDRKSLRDVGVIFRAMPTYAGDKHYGSRLAFGPDGSLFIGTGERSDQATRKYAQDPRSHLGKVLRVRPDGSALQVWSLGHRNIQAMAFDAQGRLWVIEHGARGGDEVNLIAEGRNYGWPLVAYGEEYSGEPIPGAVTDKAGYQQPVYYWDPVIAPSGAQFYTGKAFPDWQGDLFVGGLKERELVRLELQDGRVVGEEHLLGKRGERIRDVRQGPDGALYLVTDAKSGEIWKIVPRGR